MKVRVYIAGANDNVDVHNAMNTWHRLRDLGYSPYCPHLSHFLHLFKPRLQEEWLDYNLDWLETCHVVLAYDSSVDEEIVEANGLDIPIVYTIGELLDLFPSDKFEYDEYEDDLDGEEDENVYDAELFDWIDAD